MRFESTLAFERTTDGDFIVYNNSPLFRAGKFPERMDVRTGKTLEITEEDVQDMVKNFDEPVCGNLFHEDEIFDVTGFIRRIWNIGKDLFGEVAIPKWLDEHLQPNGKKISVEIDQDTLKKITGFALVTNPRITGARLMAAKDEYFAKSKPHDTYPGQEMMQRVHDIVAMSAVCVPPDKQNMAAKHELKAAQDIHDMAVEHGASCNMANYYSDTGHCPFIKVEKSMKLSEAFGKLFPVFAGKEDVSVEEVKRAIDPSGVEFKIEPATQTFDVTKTEEYVAKQRELDELKLSIEKTLADADAANKAKFSIENEAKIDGLIKLNKFDPAIRSQLIESRAKAPEVFDAMAELVATKSEYTFGGKSYETKADLDAAVSAAGMITGADLVNRNEGEAALREQINATKKSLAKTTSF